MAHIMRQSVCCSIRLLPSLIKRHSSLLTQNVRATVTKEAINLPSGNEGKLAFLLHNVLTQEECEEFITESEKRGFTEEIIMAKTSRYKQTLPTPLQVRTADSDEMITGRKSKRCIIDSAECTDELWQRVSSFIPPIFQNRKILGLNERMRILRYDAGEFFRPHLDGIYRRKNGERSILTFQLYLNEGFEGGSTTFIGADGDCVPVIPKTGSVLIFQHATLHEGSEVLSGRKYTVRTDIMCSSSVVLYNV